MMRRKSSGEASARAGSEYSPMGSKLPSRGPSRRGSAWSGFSVGGMGSRKHTQEQQQQQQRRDSGGVGLDEVEGDGGDVGNGECVCFSSFPLVDSFFPPPFWWGGRGPGVFPCKLLLSLLLGTLYYNI